jgi:hypothetical protein
MDLRSRRLFRLLLLLATALVLFACATTKPEATRFGLQRSSPAPSAARRHRPAILVIMPSNEHTAAVWNVPVEELGAEFEIFTQPVEKSTSVEALEAAIQEAKPVCLVIMDNTAFGLYQHYQHAQRTGTAFAPAIIVMTLFLEETYRSIQNATGIAYEIPGVIEFTKLRSTIERPVRRVGVIYRSPFSGFVARQTQLAKPEQIELVGVQVAVTPTQTEIASALGKLIDQTRVDALWVLNDTALLTPDLITSVWLPATSGPKQIPVIVGVSSLLNDDVHLGSFAMLPDHAALGVQAADLIFDLAENDWNIGNRTVAFPLSTKTVIDIERTRRSFGLKESALRTLEQVVR